MKKVLLSWVLMLVGFVGMGQIATYNFAPLTGITTSVSPTSFLPEVTATILTRGSGLTSESAAGGYNSSGWSLTSIDLNDYYEFTITPNASYTISPTNLVINWQKSTTGPSSYEFRTQVGNNPEVTQSTGGFGTSGSAATGSANLSMVLGTVPSLVTVRFRIYAFGATSGAGTLRLTNTLSLNGTAPLPVTLISFKASLNSSNQTVLKWATALEKDNDYFEIERSKNAVDFESLGKIKGKGTSDLRNDYTFTDETPLKGINYYRLKQVDFDGTFTFTRPESIITDGDGTVSLYPNPTVNTLKINFEDIDQIENATIYNQSGVVMKNLQGFKSSIDIQELPQGKYILQIRLADQRIIANSFVKF